MVTEGALEIIDRRNALFNLRKRLCVAGRNRNRLPQFSTSLRISVIGLTTLLFLVVVAVANKASFREALESRNDLVRYAELPLEKCQMNMNVRREKDCDQLSVKCSVYLISEELTPKNGLVTPMKLQRHFLKEVFQRNRANVC